MVAEKLRREAIARTTARIREQMDSTVKRANSKVLLNPIDAPKAVKTSNQVAVEFASSSEGVASAKRVGQETLDRATEVLPDKDDAAAAADEAGAALKAAASGVADAFGILFKKKNTKNQDAASSESETAAD